MHALSTARLERWALRLLRRWPEGRATEIDGPLLELAVSELFAPLGQFAEQELCDLEGAPRLWLGPLRDLWDRYELYRSYLPK